MFSERGRKSSRQPAPRLIDSPNHSGWMLNTNPASGSDLNMLLIDAPQSITAEKKKKKNNAGNSNLMESVSFFIKEQLDDVNC